MTSSSDLVRAHYDAMARGDLDAALAVLDPEVEWIEAAGSSLAGTYRGPAAIVEGVFAALQREWDDFRHVPEAFMGEGEQIAVLGTYSGTSKATGRAFEARVVHVWTVRDGRAVRFEQVADTVMIAAAQG